MSQKQDSVSLDVPELAVPPATQSILDQDLLKSVQNLHKAVLVDRRMIKNRVIDDFTKLLVQPNNGVVDLQKFEEDRKLEKERSGSEKAKVGEVDLKDFGDRAKKQVQALIDKGVDAKIFDPLMKYVEDGQNDVRQLLSSDKSAKAAVIDLFLKQGALSKPPAFSMIVTPEYASRGKMFQAGQSRMMDRDEVNSLVSKLYALIDFPSYKVENVLGRQRVVDQEILPLVQERMKEFFSDPHPTNKELYIFNNEKLEANKEKFARAIEGDLSVYEVSLEYVAQLQKKNPEQQIDDTRRKEILNALKVTLSRNDAVDLAYNGGETPNEMISKMNATVAGYDILLQSMKEVGGKREYAQKKDLIEAILPQIAKINPSDLEKNKKEITKLCAKAINSRARKSGFIGLFGDEMVIKKDSVNEISSALAKSLSALNLNASYEDGADILKSLPAGMPAANSKAVVDRSKASTKDSVLLQPRPPTTPFPGAATVRSAPRQEFAKIVTAQSSEKWEQSEILPSGMPAAAPRLVETKVPQAKPIPPQLQATPIKTPPSSAQSSPLEAKERSRKEVEQWQEKYNSMGFFGRRGLSRSPSKDSDVGASVKAWRKWHEANKEALETKGFIIPKDYEDVHKISSQYNNESNVLDLMSALQKDIQDKRNTVGATSVMSVTPATFRGGGSSINESNPSIPQAPNAVKKNSKGSVRESGEGRR